jgi:hypothetical protein
MSFFSIVLIVLFLILCRAIKEMIVQNIGSDEFVYTNQQGQQITVPSIPPNYLNIVLTVIGGAIFLFSIAVAIMYLWNVSLFNLNIKF